MWFSREHLGSLLPLSSDWNIPAVQQPKFKPNSLLDLPDVRQHSATASPKKTKVKSSPKTGQFISIGGCVHIYTVYLYISWFLAESRSWTQQSDTKVTVTIKVTFGIAFWFSIPAASQFTVPVTPAPQTVLLKVLGDAFTNRKILHHTLWRKRDTSRDGWT